MFTPTAKDPVRTRCKICGLTRLADVHACVQAGTDAIGFVFYASSPRAVSAIQAAELLQAVPAFIQTVGLFVDATLAEITQTLTVAPVDILQFHGDESAEACAHIGKQTGKRWIKALMVKPNTLELLDSQVERFKQAGASAILLDAWHPQLKGGTGQTFDWSILPTLSNKHNIAFILAGGLTAENVTTAIQQTHPFAVDVSGGVEATDSQTHLPIKGQKDIFKINRFIAGVNHG